MAADVMLPSIALCHHAPFAPKSLGDHDSEALGVPIPLASLVYHDCFVVPWFMGAPKGGSWEIS